MSPRSKEYFTPSPRADCTLATAIKDPDSPVFDSAGGRSSGLGFFGYLLCCLAATALSCVAAVMLWSDLGCGSRCLLELQAHSRFAPLCAGLAIGIMVVLYLLDFFLPPHLPDTHFALYAGDTIVGRLHMAVAGSLLLSALYLSAKIFPTVPLAITIFLCPLTILMIRHVTMPVEQFKGRRVTELVTNSSFQDRISMLRRVTGEERNQRDFYSAAMYAFGITVVLCLGVWVPWAAEREARFLEAMEESEDYDERELTFVTWAAPLIVSFANLVFASFAGLRVALNEAYAATDQVKNRLIVGVTDTNLNEELMRHRMSMLNQHFDNEVANTPQSPQKFKALAVAQDKMQRYLVQHISHMRQLSNIVKSVGCSFIVMLGALYVALQLTAADSHVAQMVQGLLGALFLTFVAFVYVSFHRLWTAMHVWLRDLPLWSSALHFSRTSTVRACLVVLSLPAVPLLLALSALNQCVRRCRGLLPEEAKALAAGAEEAPEAAQQALGAGAGAGAAAAAAEEEQLGGGGAATAEEGEPAQVRAARGRSGWLTERVQSALESTAEWEWVSVVWWCYLVAVLLVLWKISPLFLNVLLSWMSSLMKGLGFGSILVFTFAAGMVLFMLPPVPGPPIYLFGGFVISSECPWGFWWGSVICIALCFFLKLTACAVQQGIIGKMLGQNPWVRQTVGVHKPLIRAIEAVLQQPGLSFGKCMILCGGPDWPTSVLAGILRISLVQCELGTCPIILNVVPLALTGSFYLRRDEGETWLRAGNLMFTLTVITSVIFWAGTGWAIQNEFDRNHEALTQPKEEFVDLDWLDYRADFIRKRCIISWKDVPRLVQVPFVMGAMGLILVAHLFFWRFGLCFGEFKVTDDIADLKWFGMEGIIRPVGVSGFGIALASLLGFMVFAVWRRGNQREPAAAAAKELDAMEAEWKARQVEIARGAAAANAPAARTSQMMEKAQEWLRTATAELDVNGDIQVVVDAPELAASKSGGSKATLGSKLCECFSPLSPGHHAARPLSATE